MPNTPAAAGVIAASPAVKPVVPLASAAAVWATPVDAAAAISAEEMEDDPVVAAVAAVAVEAAAAVVTDIT